MGTCTDHADARDQPTLAGDPHDGSGPWQCDDVVTLLRALARESVSC